ncbi:ArsC/Spx/MgsR family protein (plasmid) [Rossellomorea sp. AcN35-11]|nr:transcriptional regulator Spx [Rossellomorea aquimaris]WJV32164.1 ArsC/Spx/MgsR family protein [Rossellomorea sp. AcN35-11]
MVKPISIITRSGLQSCRAAKNFLEDNNIPYIEKNVTYNPLSFEEIKDLAIRAGGYSEIVSTRSKPYKEINRMMESDDFTLFQLYKFIEENPTSLTYPIIYDDHRFQTGYNEEQLKTFLLREVKVAAYKEIVARSIQID